MAVQLEKGMSEVLRGATKRDDGQMPAAPTKGRRLPLELPGLMEIELREYAGQVLETQAWRVG